MIRKLGTTLGLALILTMSLMACKASPSSSDSSTPPPQPNLPSLSVFDAEGLEGSHLTFKVQLSHTAPAAVTVYYTTVNGTAVEPGDYTRKNEQLVFTPGQVTREVDVDLVFDNICEQVSCPGPPETMHLYLYNAVGAQIADGEAVGTVIDDFIK